jgi:hypothetical protein
MISWISFIPESSIIMIVHTLLVIGIVAYFASRYSGIYKFILSPIAIIIIISTIFAEGIYYNQKKYQEQMQEYQNKIHDAEEEAKKASDNIRIKYIDKVKVIKETSDENVKYIEKVVTQYDSSCTLSNAAIMLHNSSSQNVVARSSGGIDEGTSDVKASELLKVITDNYSTYYQVREQLLGWQDWYKEQKKIYESVK